MLLILKDLVLETVLKFWEYTQVRLPLLLWNKPKTRNCMTGSVLLHILRVATSGILQIYIAKILKPTMSVLKESDCLMFIQ